MRSPVNQAVCSSASLAANLRVGRITCLCTASTRNWSKRSFSCCAKNNRRSALCMSTIISWWLRCRLYRSTSNQVIIWLIKTKTNPETRKLQYFFHFSGGPPIMYGVINGSVHVVMYLYYFLTILQPAQQSYYAQFKPRITEIQLVDNISKKGFLEVNNVLKRFHRFSSCSWLGTLRWTCWASAVDRCSWLCYRCSRH